MRSKSSNVQPVLEEFIPLKKDCDEEGKIKKEKDCKDKKNWMSSVQLWNNDDSSSTDHFHDKKQESKSEIKQVKIEFSNFDIINPLFSSKLILFFLQLIES